MWFNFDLIPHGKVTWLLALNTEALFLCLAVCPTSHTSPNSHSTYLPYLYLPSSLCTPLKKKVVRTNCEIQIHNFSPLLHEIKTHIPITTHFLCILKTNIYIWPKIFHVHCSVSRLIVWIWNSYVHCGNENGTPIMQTCFSHDWTTRRTRHNAMYDKSSLSGLMASWQTKMVIMVQMLLLLRHVK